MIAAGVKRLPVLDDDRLVGIVSRSDVLNSMHRNDDELQGEINAALEDPAQMPEDSACEGKRRGRRRHIDRDHAISARRARVVVDRLALSRRGRRSQ